MYKSQVIPTIFAKAVAIKVGLLPSESEEVKAEDMYTVQNAEVRLVCFQQMSISSPFEDALLAYHGVELSEEQRTALQLIHRSTTPWLIGHVVAELVDGSKGTGKNAEFILTQLIKEGKVDQKTAKSLLIKLEVIDATKPIASVESKT